MRRARHCVAGRHRAAQAAAALDIPRHHGSYQELLDGPDIEAVYLPLPNNLHAEWASRAAEAGKHVLCEKPLAMNSPEAARMVDGAARAGVLLMEAFMYRLHPLWTRTRELVAEGRIGELVAISVVLLLPQYGPGQHPQHRRTRRRRADGHRVLPDQRGPHDVR